MIRRLYEAVTGSPWTTGRRVSVEFGPPPGARYADQLAGYSDLDLLLHNDRIRASLRDQQPRRRKVPAVAASGGVRR